MKEFDCRCYRLLLDEDPMSVQQQDWQNTPNQQVESTSKGLLLQTITTPVVRRPVKPYDQSPIVGEISAGTLFQVRHRNDPCLATEIWIGAPP